MLDENLPTFFLKPSADNVKHHRSFYLAQHGIEPEPAYFLRGADPATPNGRNCYAAALFDSFSPDVLYGEVLIQPEWSQPSLSQEEIRRNGGAPPPPQPVMPTEFTVQLYNPDQQITVTQKSGSWGGSSSYEFNMPQNTFRLPSASTLDRSQNDPGVAATTPKVNFVWKRDSKLSKDFTCYLAGKSTDVKKKHKEPDIVVALFRSLREITIYEPNLIRVDMEDPKGLEVVVLLGAAVIRDIFFGNIKEAFNVQESARTSAADKNGHPIPPPAGPNAPNGNAAGRPLPPSQNSGRPGAASAPPSQNAQSAKDLRSQWEIDQETTRLAAQHNNEARAEASRRREQERRDEAEARRISKVMEKEDKDRRKKQQEVEKETERLRRKYGAQQDLLVRPPAQPGASGREHRYSTPLMHHGPTSRPAPAPMQYQQQPSPQPGYAYNHAPPHQPHAPMRASDGLYMQRPGSSAHASSSGFLSRPNDPTRLAAPKRSIWGLRSASNGQAGRLAKKTSSLF